MSLADYYGDSYPPELWETPAAPVAAARASAAAEFPATTLQVVAGAPGHYVPELRAAERPTNVTELRERARPVHPAPWAPGQYVPVGERGKRAHWDGADWRGGEAPTVPGGTVERSPADRSPRSDA